MVSTSNWTPPYPPSWFDRFTASIERLPGPAWVYYSALFVILFAAESAAQWVAGTYPVGSFSRLHLLVTATIIYLPAFMHYLNRAASAALTSFRPALDVSEEGYKDLRYRLTTLPARQALFTSLVGLGIAVVALVGDPTMAPLGISSASVSIAFNLALVIIAWFCWALLPYQLVRQLNLVNTIYTRFTKIRFLQLSPLYSLSGFTARAAIGLLIGIYAWFIVSPDLIRDPAVLAVYILGMTLAAAAFFLPLLGIHRLLQEEKHRWLLDASYRLEACVLELHRGIDQSNLTAVGQIKDAIAALDTELRRLHETPTWPWQPGTPRTLLVALFLPVAIWLLQTLAARYLRM